MKKIILLTVLTAGLFACDNSHDNMYDPNWVREQYNKQWEMNFGEIAPDQNFNMAKQVMANISIKEDALSEYTFKIYTANPLYDNNAKLMAKTVVTTDDEGYAETSITFDALVGQESFYVTRVNSRGRRLVKALPASDGVIDAAFGIQSVGGTRSRAAEMGDLPTMTCPYTEAEVNKFIEEGYDLSKGLEYINQYGGADVVKSFYSVALAANNVGNSTIAVIKTTMDALSTYDTGYYIKGNKKTFDWNPALEAYEVIWGQITEPGTVKAVVVSGGVLNYNNSNIINMDIIVASGGTLVLNNTFDMGTNARLIVMPGGKVIDNTANGFSLKNNDGTSLVYNAGTIEGVRSYLQNSGTTYIASTGVLTGDEITLQNGDCVLTNWGKIDVDRIIGNGQQGTINNACLLRSDEKIQVLFLNQAPNTAVECNEIYVNHVTLRENSLLRSKHLDMNGSGSFIDYVGTSGSSAMVSALWFGVNNANTKITGAVYVEAGEYESEDDRKAVVSTAPLGVTTVGEADFAIFPVYTGDELKESDCTGGGNIPNDYGPTTEDTAQSWIVACEDLGSVGDYDFNDVVFEVKYVGGSTKADVTALAGGGTLAAYIHRMESQGNSTVVGEIHDMFGFDDITLMVNTGVDYEWNGRNGFKGKTVTIDVPSTFSMSENMGGFYLLIKNGDGEWEESNIGPSTGTPPQMICVPSSWRWPQEVVRINEAYPDFGAWGSGYDTDGVWCSNIVLDKVY